MQAFKDAISSNGCYSSNLFLRLEPFQKLCSLSITVLKPTAFGFVVFYTMEPCSLLFGADF